LLEVADRLMLAFRHGGEEEFGPEEEALPPVAIDAQRLLDQRLHEICGSLASGAPRWRAQALSGVVSYRIGAIDWMVIAGVECEHPSGVAGAYQPASQELFITEPGACWSVRAGNRKQLETRQYRSLERAVLCLGDGVASAVNAQREAIYAMSSQVMLRRSVAPSLGLCLLALGEIDLFVDTRLTAAEACVLGLLVRRAGGVITDWNGSTPDKGQIVASANETLHQRALEVLGWKSGGIEQIHPQLLQ